VQRDVSTDFLCTRRSLHPARGSRGGPACRARHARHARELAERLRDAGGDVTPELRRLLTDRWSRAANVGSAIAMLGVLWLMVAKP
jgi:hypothetical protein